MLRIIAKSEGHPGAEQIYEQLKGDFPTTSLATIYKTLTLPKDMGEVLDLIATVGSRYDGNKPYPHPHVICIKYGQILDPEFTSMAEISQEMARLTGYQITHHQLNFFGAWSPGGQEYAPPGRSFRQRHRKWRRRNPGAP